MFEYIFYPYSLHMRRIDVWFQNWLGTKQKWQITSNKEGTKKSDTTILCKA